MKGGKTFSEVKAEESIHNAAAYGIIKQIKEHLISGINVNAKDEKGWTPFHHSAHNGYNKEATAIFLINEGANINAINNSGETPLDLAMVYTDFYFVHEETKYEKLKDKLINLYRKHGAKTGDELKAAAK